ncbi:phosphate uptake regulator, PhoU [Thermaerobacter marianensis DSM 12885]|uniref:Phosphate-specific transport system accessory protein PhoU n=1 Tax=Thermaerobacter marianensis (strain ATCC 700841 / DSM 12885 / JCM 10246 / 7p75a) TaxID=644966 RepID=E6SH90_THEM7|nr:phosphate signaling complex protein PhoU [Thermaerobacter marianensis]ADU51754.1 phosphate uptake regulator, PhoU [Thermaerobacter marianensis DSM 12885]
MARVSYHAELDALRQDLLRMGTQVEEAIRLAVESLKERNADKAQRVLTLEDEVDRMELDIERRCLNLIALQQPMAGDLRQIGMTLKVITDLERMADHAHDIAKVTLRLGDEPLIKPLVDIPRMAEVAEKMVRDGLKAFVEGDVELARAMVARDDELDHLFNQIFRELLMIMREKPGTVDQATQLLMVGSHLERIGDHATNLAEWVIYLVTGVRQELND